MTDVRCESGHIAFSQGQYTQRWQCHGCDYDMCIKCVQKFAFINIGDITNRDCATAYFVLQSSVFPDVSGIFINRFLREESAIDYYARIQRKSINS